jgi:Flp pilus assembly protein TadD
MKLRDALLTFGIAFALGGCANPTDPLTDSVRAGPGNTRASLKQLGQTTFDAGDYPSAIGYFRRAHKESEHDFEALLGLGTALVRVGANDEAAETLRKALALKPDDPEARRKEDWVNREANARRELGNALVGLGQPSLAVVEFEAAFDANRDVRCLNGLGIALDLMGQQSAAQAQYRAGLQMEPGNVTLGNNLALSLAVSGQYREALSLLEPIARAPGSTVRQRQNLALVYGLAGQRDRAAQVARMDLDEIAVRQNLVYYETLRAMGDPRKVAEAVGLRRRGAPAGL